MNDSGIEQLRGSFCLAAGRDAVDEMQSYLGVAANDPCREGVLTMAFSLALLEQREKSLRKLVPILAAEGVSDEKQQRLAQAQGAGNFFEDLIKRMNAEHMKAAA